MKAVKLLETGSGVAAKMQCLYAATAETVPNNYMGCLVLDIVVVIIYHWTALTYMRLHL